MVRLEELSREQLLTLVFAYEVKIDGEFACCCSVDNIIAGECEYVNELREGVLSRVPRNQP